MRLVAHRQFVLWRLAAASACRLEWRAVARRRVYAAFHGADVFVWHERRRGGCSLRQGLWARGDYQRRGVGPRRPRACQQPLCQWRRSAIEPCSAAGHTTTCGTPGLISWSQPGHRYVLVACEPVTARTSHSPSADDSACGHAAGSGRSVGLGRARRDRLWRGTTPTVTDCGGATMSACRPMPTSAATAPRSSNCLGR